MPRIEIDGTTLHYQDTLRGQRAVLLLHAFPLHSGMWADQLAALADHRVIAPDTRGLGQSSPAAAPCSMARLAEDARALLAALGVDRAAVVGLSMGGYVAFELYRRAPGLFQGLVLSDTRPGADSAEGRAGRERFAQTALDRGLGWVADEMLPKLLRPGAPAATTARVRAWIADGTVEGVAAAQRGMAARPDSGPTLPTITCPTLVMVGADDALTPPVEAEAMACAIAGSELVSIPDAGHLPCVENPAAFNRALRGFLARLPA